MARIALLPLELARVGAALHVGGGVGGYLRCKLRGCGLSVRVACRNEGILRSLLGIVGGPVGGGGCQLHVLVHLAVLAHRGVRRGGARCLLGWQHHHWLVDGRVAQDLSAEGSLDCHEHFSWVLVALPWNLVATLNLLGDYGGVMLPLEGYGDRKAVPFLVQVEGQDILADGAMNEHAVVDRGAAAAYLDCVRSQFLTSSWKWAGPKPRPLSVA